MTRTWYLATVIVDDKIDDGIKMILCYSQFWRPCGWPVQCKAHCLMHHVQGYTGSHRTLPLGDYLLSIAPAAARATANKTKMNKCTLDGCGGALVRHRTHRPIEEDQGFTRSHWTLLLDKYCGQLKPLVIPTLVFLIFSIVKTVEKGHWLMQRPLLSIRVWHIKQKRRT